MMEIQPQSLKAGKSSRSILIWSVVAAASAMANLLFLWVTSLRLTENVTVFYWQRFEIYFFYLRLLTFIITPIAIWFVAGIKSGVWAFVTATIVTIGYFLIFGFINYTSLFMVNIITNNGTVELKGNIYHLVDIWQYDEETVFELGKCDITGFVCKFHEIYNTGLYNDPVSEISLNKNAQSIIIKINNEIVYTNDGHQERCTDNTSYGCLIDNNSP